jgi:hypothetical protein
MGVFDAGAPDTGWLVGLFRLRSENPTRGLSAATQYPSSAPAAPALA